MTDKTLKQLTGNDKLALGQVLQWQGTNLRDCSKGDLIECVLHLTMQVALTQDTIESLTLPFYRRKYWTNRFYFRGWSWLGLINTVSAFICNRVFVREVENTDAGLVTVGWSIAKGTNFPKSKK